MFDKVRRLFPILMSMAVFFTLFYLLVRILPGIQCVEIDLEGDHPDTLRVYYSNSKLFHEEAASGLLPFYEKRSKLKVFLSGSFANSIRIDTGLAAGTVKIYEIKLLSYFSDPVVLGPAEISSLFFAGPESEMRLSDDHVLVKSAGNDPYIISKTRLFEKRYWQSCAVALTFAAFLLLITFPFATVSKSGLEESRPSAAQAEPARLDALDGLRGLAAIMVIADHTCGWFRGVGASAVWIFFALSGFLLARPFLDNPRKILSLSYMAGYFRRRYMRILPMYYTYVFLIFVVSGRENLAFMHGLFLEGDGHLWAIPQEILFYILWPCLVLALVLPLRRFPKTTMLALFLCMAAWNHFVGIKVIWLLGMDHIRLPLFFGVFLAGVFFSFVHASYAASVTAGSRVDRIARGLASPLGFTLLLLFFLFSTGNIFGRKAIYSQQYFGYYGALAGCLVFCIVLAQERVLGRVLTLAPLRELGIVGLSLYLVHPLVKKIAGDFFTVYFDMKLKGFPLFLATLCGSFLLARYTYLHIERPGFLAKLGKIHDSRPSPGVNPAPGPAAPSVS